uniref:Uncharacterized protein n=1 Tax=Avena sativa TaxID=4498 RepID=A0ACD5TAT1_AVESA
MDLSSALQWWDEWQLRILVLGSLFLQFFLYFADHVRTMPILRKFKVLVWIAYIGSDALAIYALATLFNRHRPLAADGGSTALEVVWAPILLIHLGGQPAISAYSLEDNELWRRHVITLVSQVTVALYVFLKWWSGKKRLLEVAALLFIIGIVKFGQKPFALRRASFNSMLDSTAIDPRREGRLIPSCWTYWTSSIPDIALAGSKGGGATASAEQEENLDIFLGEYVQQAKKYVQDTTARTDQDEYPTIEIDHIYRMFVDVSTTYSGRLTKLQPFLVVLDGKKVDDLLRGCLSYTFRILYTKSRTMDSILGYLIRLLFIPFLALAALVLFAVIHKHGYSEKDVMVTYILICCNAMQEFVPYFLCILACSFRLLPCLNACFFRCLACLLRCLSTTHHSIWQDMVSQYSLLSFAVRSRKPTILMKFATFICLRGYINKNWYIGKVLASPNITGLVLGYVKDGWKEYISDAASYRRFSNLRGQWTLHRLGLEKHQRQQIAWSFKVAFDRSVLLWHIATDLCFYHPNTSLQGRDTTATQRSREISNYMTYLLFIHPEMLLPGTRPSLFDLASYVLGPVFKDSKAPLHEEERLALEIMDHMKSSTTGGDLIRSACRLAEALMELDDEERRWQVIQGVWVEMLCYSAARCRGYLHAKSLGEGVEYLSYVWLLWSYMGMETLADKSQKPEEPPEGEEVIVPTTVSVASQSDSDDDDDDDDDTDEESSSPVQTRRCC